MSFREYRVSLGMDVHPLSKKRKFYLCGVCVSEKIGPVGHSDGDPICHSIADALLSAGGLPDIGVLFPDSDDRFKNLPGDVLLQKSVQKVSELGWKIENVDAILWLESPPIAPYTEEIRSRLAKILRVDMEQIGLKVKRGEGLGFVGRGEGTMAFSTAVLTRPKMKKVRREEKPAEVYADGGSKRNPGPSACAAVICYAGKIQNVFGEALGWATNNVAEYCGALLGMKESLKKGYERVVIRSDSELLIRQMQGEYEITDEKLLKKAEEIREMAQEFQQVKWELISREENRLAHRIVELILEAEK